jgi:hypothetical protein
VTVANLPLAFAELLGGGVLLTAGISGQPIQDVFAGKVTLGAPAATPASAPSSAPASSGARQGDVAMSDLRSIGGVFGWGADQLGAWWKVIAQESGGRADAVNKSSGAFGIGQFLGKTKDAYAHLGATSSEPAQQLNAMAHYIHDRYGTPAAALAHEQKYGWY